MVQDNNRRHGNFRLVLENNAGTYTSLFQKTRQFSAMPISGLLQLLFFEGYIESLKKEFGEYGHTLIVTGQHDGDGCSVVQLLHLILILR